MPISAQAADFIVNATTAGDQQFSAAAGLSDGRFVIVYVSPETGGTIRGQAYNSDGTSSGSEFVLTSPSAGEPKFPSITALADGRFVVTWNVNDGGDGDGQVIRAAICDLDDLGSPVDGTLVNSTSAGNQTNPSVTPLANGSFVIAWQSADGTDDASGTGIRARYFDASGNAVGSDFLVNTTLTGDQAAPRITALDGGGWVATWTSTDGEDASGGCVRARLYDSSGAAVGNDFVVNATAVDGNQVEQQITALAGGGFAVTFTTPISLPSDIIIRFFDESGTPLGPDFTVNTTTTGFQDVSSVTQLADGRVVVAWTSNEGGRIVRAQLLSDTGTLIGSEFVVNTSASSQSRPSVAALDDGRFVISWTDETGSDGNGRGIRARIFDPTVFIGTSGGDSWIGGGLADHITGAGDNDSLTGMGGDDVISGDAGNDTLDGGDGNDKLFGGAGDDDIRGGAGRDSVHGGAGQDFIAIFDGEDASGEIYDGGAGSADLLILAGASTTFTIDLSDDQLANVEYLQLNGSFNPGGQMTAIVSAAQAAAFVGVIGDTLSDRSVILQIVMGGQAGLDLSAKNFMSFDAQDRTEIIGDGDAETIAGSSVNDSISGNNGEDDLRGGAGRDTLRGGDDSDVIRIYGVDGVVAGEIFDGGNGTDTLYVDHDPIGWGAYDLDFGLVSLAGFEALTMYAQYDGASPYDAVARFKSSQFGSGLSTTAVVSVVNNVAASSERVVVTMDTANINLAGLTFTAGSFGQAADRFEITGTTAGNVITGTSVRDSINGGNGDDTIRGGGGNDSLDGGGGSHDTVDYSDKSQAVVLTLGDPDVVVGGVVEDSAVNFENAIGGSGADELYGSAVANSLVGGGADDWLMGGGGKDTLVGGSGKDTADFSDKTTKVTVTLVNGGATVTINASDKDTLSGIENVNGGTAGDKLTGDKYANMLAGRNGGDTLNGGLGKDTLDGGNAADKFVFSTTLGPNNVDTIVSFSHNSDVIQLAKSIFKTVGATLDPNEFHSANGAVKAHDADDRIIYNKSNGRLYYDDDGNKAGGHDAIWFATLVNKPGTLDSGDFLMI